MPINPALTLVGIDRDAQPSTTGVDFDPRPFLRKLCRNVRLERRACRRRDVNEGALQACVDWLGRGVGDEVTSRKGSLRCAMKPLISMYSLATQIGLVFALETIWPTVGIR